MSEMAVLVGEQVLGLDGIGDGRALEGPGGVIWKGRRKARRDECGYGFLEGTEIVIYSKDRKRRQGMILVVYPSLLLQPDTAKYIIQSTLPLHLLTGRSSIDITVVDISHRTLVSHSNFHILIPTPSCKAL